MALSGERRELAQIAAISECHQVSGLPERSERGDHADGP
jgi:hypothetical protein